MSNPFLEVLTQEPEVPEPFQEPLTVLDEFCRAIGEYTQDRVKVWRERGFLVNYGQEWRVLMQSASGGPVQPVFRAYVPLQGYPVQLDLHQEGLQTCRDRAALEAALAEFLRDVNVREQIRYFAQ
jgi:hypothetical protein